MVNQSTYLSGKQFRAAYDGPQFQAFLQLREKADPDGRFASQTMKEMFGF